MDIRKAVMDDLVGMMEIIEQARDYFKRYDIAQWQDGYPDDGTIKEDINRGEAYIFFEDGQTIGFAVIALDSPPPYESGDAAPPGRYAAIHRLAIDEKFKNRGFATEFMSFAYGLCKKSSVDIIRIDTHKDNLAMRRTLRKSGFERCGTLSVDGGDCFLVYEKQIKLK